MTWSRRKCNCPSRPGSSLLHGRCLHLGHHHHGLPQMHHCPLLRAPHGGQEIGGKLITNGHIHLKIMWIPKTVGIVNQLQCNIFYRGKLRADCHNTPCLRVSLSDHLPWNWDQSETRTFSLTQKYSTTSSSDTEYNDISFICLVFTAVSFLL